MQVRSGVQKVVLNTADTDHFPFSAKERIFLLLKVMAQELRPADQF